MRNTLKVLKDVETRKSLVAKAIRDGNVSVKDFMSLQEQYAFVYKDHSGNSALGMGRSGSANLSGSTNDYIQFIITTLEEDRDGDIVVPMGRVGKNYANNPVWFFGHQEWEIPIGTSRAPDGSIAVVSQRDKCISNFYPDRADPDAMFVFGKVQRGILNATSIAFVPLIAQRREEMYKSNPRDTRPSGWRFDSWDHTETSIVGVPANAGAIRDSLDKEKSFITPRLQKALKPYAAKSRKEQGIVWSGWCPNGDCTVKKAAKKDCGCKSKAVKKSFEEWASQALQIAGIVAAPVVAGVSAGLGAAAVRALRQWWTGGKSPDQAAGLIMMDTDTFTKSLADSSGTSGKKIEKSVPVRQVEQQSDGRWYVMYGDLGSSGRINGHSIAGPFQSKLQADKAMQKLGGIMSRPKSLSESSGTAGGYTVPPCECGGKPDCPCGNKKKKESAVKKGPQDSPPIWRVEQRNGMWWVLSQHSNPGSGPSDVSYGPYKTEEQALTVLNRVKQKSKESAVKKKTPVKQPVAKSKPVRKADMDEEDQVMKDDAHDLIAEDIEMEEPFTVKPSAASIVKTYQHAKAEAEFLDDEISKLDHPGIEEGLTKYKAKFVDPRMEHLKGMLHTHHAKGEGDPDEFLDKCMKGMETDGTGGSETDPGEEGMVQAGEIPPEDEVVSKRRKSVRKGMPQEYFVIEYPSPGGVRYWDGSKWIRDLTSAVRYENQSEAQSEFSRIGSNGGKVSRLAVRDKSKDLEEDNISEEVDKSISEDEVVSKRRKSVRKSKAIFDMLGGRSMAEKVAQQIGSLGLRGILPELGNAGPVGGWVHVEGPSEKIEEAASKLGSKLRDWHWDQKSLRKDLEDDNISEEVEDKDLDLVEWAEQEEAEPEHEEVIDEEVGINPDEDTEEILERYQHPKNLKWYTRKVGTAKRVGNKLVLVKEAEFLEEEEETKGKGWFGGDDDPPLEDILFDDEKPAKGGPGSGPNGGNGKPKVGKGSDGYWIIENVNGTPKKVAGPYKTEGEATHSLLEYSSPYAEMDVDEEGVEEKGADEEITPEDMERLKKLTNRLKDYGFAI